jgi:Fe-S cluster assembly protein SufD
MMNVYENLNIPKEFAPFAQRAKEELMHALESVSYDENYGQFSLKKFTDIRSLEKFGHELTQDIDVKVATTLMHNDVVLAFVNGRLRLDLSKSNDSVEISSLKDVKDIASRFSSTDPAEKLINSTLMDGTYIHFKKTSNLQRVAILNIYTASKETSLLSHSLIIDVDKFCELNITDETYSDSNKDFFLRERILTSDAGTKIDYNYISATSKDNLKLDHFKFILKKDSLVKFHSFNFDEGSSRLNIETEITETGAHFENNNLLALNVKAAGEINSLITHMVGPSTSEQLTKAILANEAFGKFRGKVKINKGANLVNAKQLNKNILLTKKAQIKSEPQLEIFADDVKCSHGSTTGQISEAELFYLESRGINKERAKVLLLKAFSEEILFKMAPSYLKETLSKSINEKFGSIIHLGGEVNGTH